MQRVIRSIFVLSLLVILGFFTLSVPCYGYTFELYIIDGEKLKRYMGIDHEREFVIPVRVIIRSEKRGRFVIGLNGYPLRTLGPDTRRQVSFGRSSSGKIMGGGNYLETEPNYDYKGHKNPFIFDASLIVFEPTAGSKLSGIPPNSSMLIGFKITRGYYHNSSSDGVNRRQAIEIIRVPNTMHKMTDIGDASVLWDRHIRPVGDVSDSYIPAFTSDLLGDISGTENIVSEQLEQIQKFSIIQRIDLNHDGIINLGDFLIFSQYFGIEFEW